MEKWIRAIPEGSHGSGTIQKRLWKLVSDFTRIRDFHAYGKCVATGKPISHWKEGDAGHYIGYTSCNGMFKFDIWNVHLQSSNSNAWGDQSTGFNFGEELKRRYGENFLEELKAENKLHVNEKLYKQTLVEEMEEIIEMMKSLPEQPDYYERVIKLREENV